MVPPVKPCPRARTLVLLVTFALLVQLLPLKIPAPWVPTVLPVLAPLERSAQQEHMARQQCYKLPRALVFVRLTTTARLAAHRQPPFRVARALLVLRVPLRFRVACAHADIMAPPRPAHLAVSIRTKPTMEVDHAWRAPQVDCLALDFVLVHRVKLAITVL
jgi:hypothetical protein